MIRELPSTTCTRCGCTSYNRNLWCPHCGATTTEPPAIEPVNVEVEAEPEVYPYRCVDCDLPLRESPSTGLLIDATHCPYCTTELPGLPGRRRPRRYHRADNRCAAHWHRVT